MPVFARFLPEMLKESDYEKKFRSFPDVVTLNEFRVMLGGISECTARKLINAIVPPSITVIPIALIRLLIRFGVSTSNTVNLDIAEPPTFSIPHLANAVLHGDRELHK